MGYAAGRAADEHGAQARAGLLPADRRQGRRRAGTYRIAPMETLTGAAELLRMPKPGGGNYYIEYRQPIGWLDCHAPRSQGVLIRTEAPAPSEANGTPTRR